MELAGEEVRKVLSFEHLYDNILSLIKAVSCYMALLSADALYNSPLDLSVQVDRSLTLRSNVSSVDFHLGTVGDTLDQNLGSPHPLRESVEAAQLVLLLPAPHMGEGRRGKQDFVVMRSKGRQIQDQSQTWIFVLKQGCLETWVVGSYKGRVQKPQ